MAKILFASELGGGMGHIAPFFPIAQQLLSNGHELTLALRDLSRVSSLFGTTDVTILQSPVKTNRTRDVFPSPVSLPQILHNVGFGEQNSLTGLIAGWRTILKFTKPDLVIADHAPGALIAVQGLDVPVALLGNGFFSPPPTYPMSALAESTIYSGQSIVDAEDSLLANVNAVLANNRQPLLSQIGKLFDQPTRLLTTFAELDHYQGSNIGDYVGVWPYKSSSQVMPDWPPGDGPRIFAYLKRSTGLGQLLDWLGERGLPSLMLVDGMHVDQLRSIAKPNLYFCERPLPLVQVAKECDFAILNATHGTTCSLLLSGKPILQIPHNLEQSVTARNSALQNSSVTASKDNGAQIVWELSSLLQEQQYSEGALAFASRYHDFSPEASIAEVVARLHDIL